MTARLSSRHRPEAEGSGFLRKNDGQEKGCCIVGGCSEVYLIVVEVCHAMVDAVVTLLLPIFAGLYLWFCGEVTSEGYSYKGTYQTSILTW